MEPKMMLIHLFAKRIVIDTRNVIQTKGKFIVFRANPSYSNGSTTIEL